MLSVAISAILLSQSTHRGGVRMDYYVARGNVATIALAESDLTRHHIHWGATGFKDSEIEIIMVSGLKKAKMAVSILKHGRYMVEFRKNITIFDPPRKVDFTRPFPSPSKGSRRPVSHRIIHERLGTST